MNEHGAKMTEQEYRAHPGVNKSTLWEIRKSPAHYKWATENPSEDTPALRTGRAIHANVLQPDEFPEMYAVAPDVDRRTKEGKAVWAEFVEQSGGKEVLTEKEFEEIEEISRSVKQAAWKMLEGCETEVPLFWDDPRTGIRCKCRVDAMKELEDRFIVIDLKTTTDASMKKFTRDAVNFGYHVQAAHYINGVKANGLNNGKPVEWWFIAVEKNAPYAVNIIQADDGFVDEGQYKLMELMDKLDECMRVDEYPGYGENVMMMPAWAVDTGEDV